MNTLTHCLNKLVAVKVAATEMNAVVAAVTIISSWGIGIVKSVKGTLTRCTSAAVGYQTAIDQAQGTAFQRLGKIGNDNDQCCVGTLHLYDPSSTTFVKHFLSNVQNYHNENYSTQEFVAGYFNTTTAITRVQFKMSSGNIDSGVIKLYGIS